MSSKKYNFCKYLRIYKLNRFKDVIFPPVDAHSETVSDKRNEVAEEVTSEDEVKKKKHRREKIGFRDRKVRICFYPDHSNKLEKLSTPNNYLDLKEGLSLCNSLRGHLVSSNDLYEIHYN